MTESEFLSLLNTIDFSQRYWALCDRFPVDLGVVGKSGRKKDIIAAFRELGIDPEYDARDQSYVCEQEEIAGVQWSGTFCKQRNGLELLVGGESKDQRIGSNFAVLAYDAKCLAEPSFRRGLFKGPPPYPRPDHNGNAQAMKEIVKEFVVLLRSIKNAIRKHSTGEQ